MVAIPAHLLHLARPFGAYYECGKSSISYRTQLLWLQSKSPEQGINLEGKPMTGVSAAGAQIQARLFMRISGLVIAVGQALDVATTNAVLTSGGAELNPLMRISMAKLGSLWWLPKAAIAIFILAYVFSRRTPVPT